MPREFSRGRRIADAVQRELSHLIQKEIRDPRLGLVTINEVVVTRDLSFADVHVTLLGCETEEQQDQSVEVLNGAGGFLRSLLARKLSTRTTPKLRFHYDKSLDRGAYMSKLIDEARKGDAE